MQRFSALINTAVRLSVPAVSRSAVALEFTYAPKRSPKEKEDTKTLRARLLYQSKKRGILENDILIGDFADENLSSMTHAELLDYDKLINGQHMEWDLYYYMSGKKQPPADVANSPTFHKLKEYVSQKAKQAERK